MLKRLARYNKKELGDYPQVMLDRGELEYDYYVLTREAQSEVEQISALENKLIAECKSHLFNLKELVILNQVILDLPQYAREKIRRNFERLKPIIKDEN